MKTTNIISIFIILISFLITWYFYDKLPDPMASHWNSQGNADGYMQKDFGLLIMPILSIIIFGFSLLIPIIDPLRKNIEKFRIYFDSFFVLILLFLLYIYLLTIYWNLGYKFNMNYMVIPAISLLFYFVGILLSNAKRNWFIGIRTPWTLSSEVVWNKTHKLGGRLFRILGIISFLGIFIGSNAVYFIIIPFIVFIFSLFIYSYVEYGDEIMKLGKHKLN